MVIKDRACAVIVKRCLVSLGRWDSRYLAIAEAVEYFNRLHGAALAILAGVIGGAT